jgi:diguanylate cyclase (GGDEF)-like protein/PAS domain S-box-containing protein
MASRFKQNDSNAKNNHRLLNLLTFAIDSSGESVFLIGSHASHFLYVNDTAAKTLGYSKEELSNGMGVFSIDPDYAGDDVWRAHIKALEADGNQIFETRHRSKDGRIYPVEVTSTIFHYGDERYILSLAQDITKRRAQAEQLAAKEREFRTLSENSPDTIMRYNLLGQRIYANTMACLLFGTNENNLVGKTPDDGSVFSLANIDVFKRSFAEVVRTGKVMEFEAEYTANRNTHDEYNQLVPTRLALTGMKGWGYIKLIPEFNEHNEIISVLLVGRDITAIKQTQFSLEQSNKQFRSLVEGTPDTICRYDADCKRVYANPAFLRLMPEDAIAWGTKPTELSDTASSRAYEAAIRETFATSRECTIELEWQDKDNNTLISQIQLVPEINDRSDVQSVLAVGRDITEQKRTEDQLAARERELRTLVENLPDNVIRYSRECRAIYVTPLLDKAYGKEASAILIGKTPLEVHGDIADVRAYQEKLEYVIVTGENDELEITLPIFTGEVRTHHIRFIPEKLPSGEVCSVLAIGRDVTEEQESNRMLHLFSQSLNNTLESVFITDESTSRFIYVNDTAAKILEYSKEELIGGMGVSDIDPHVDMDILAQVMQEIKTKGAMNLESTHISKSGHIYPIDVTSSHFEYKDKGYFLAITRDISLRKQMEKRILDNEIRLKAAQKIAHVGSWELAFPSLELSWSEEIYRIFELDPNSFKPSYDHFLNLTHPEDRAMVDANFQQSIIDKTPYNLTHRLLMPDGRIKYVHEIGETSFDTQGNPVRSVGTVQDVTAQKQSELKMKHMAHHDSLTGLSNRAHVREIVTSMLHHADASGSMVAFVFIDLDGFKAVNDTLGHSIGDVLLQKIAKRLQGQLNSKDILSRQGGDEFLLVLSDLTSLEDAIQSVQALQDLLDQPFNILDYSLSASMSLGIAVYPMHGSNFDDLLRKADTAMYQAKESGKNTYAIYSDATNAYTLEKLTIQSEIKKAIKQDNFQLYYQPQIDINSGQLVGAEALIRWLHPERGMINPNDFIAAAEVSGLIVPLGEWVIHQACKQIADWHKKGLHLTVAVNVSPIQLKRGNIERVVKEALANTQIQPEWLELELTESSMMTDAEASLQTLRNLKAFGVKLAIDDFGTGYSSLAYLKRFAVNKLKIDKSFITDLKSNPEDIVIVRTIVQMAKNLNLLTIAEGVEDKAIIELMTLIGCNEVQGYYYSKPLPVADFEAFAVQFNHEKY